MPAKLYRTGLQGVWSCVTLLALVSGVHAQTGWPAYGGDAGGRRYSDAAQISRANVQQLHPVWQYHTHANDTKRKNASHGAFEATPILFGDALYLTTPFDEIIALDAMTGAERWHFDPQLAGDLEASNYTSRGVAAWKGPVAPVCASRIFMGTLDARLIAVDAVTGERCKGFGDDGQVDLRAGLPTQDKYPYQLYGVTSPPTVVGNVVVIGSAVGDNQQVDVEPGCVRGYDAVTGRLLWTWDPMPWAAQQKIRTGAANTWSVISADPERGLVYLPTSSPSPDFYGALRPGDDRDANSLVALDAATGRKVWAFQLVHHDLWDYDIAAQPLLFDYKDANGKVIPAIVVSAKPGILFVLNRVTGVPIYPVTERAVPQSDVPDETASPTQPFSTLPLLIPTELNLQEMLAAHGDDGCARKLRSMHYEGLFTPPELRSTLEYPGSLGGVNWGSFALDPETGVLYANVNRSAYEIRLVKRLPAYLNFIDPDFAWISVPGSIFGFVVLVVCIARRRVLPGWDGLAAAILVGLACLMLYWHLDPPSLRPKGDKFINSPDVNGELSEQRRTPYEIFRRALTDDAGRPCTLPPWGLIRAVNLNTGQDVWSHPLGTMIAGKETGAVNLGGPMVTAGGLVFTAASTEPLLRAYDKTTGEEVWQGQLPVPAQSTPMSYMLGGKQFVVIDAGGHGGLGTPLGDSVIAFAVK
jgi:quinoprotein glucose dehydrogenase